MRRGRADGVPVPRKVQGEQRPEKPVVRISTVGEYRCELCLELQPHLRLRIGDAEPADSHRRLTVTNLTRRIGVMSRRLARRFVWRQQGSSRRGSHPTSTTRCARSSVSATPRRLGASFTPPRLAKTERFEFL